MFTQIFFTVCYGIKKLVRVLGLQCCCENDRSLKRHLIVDHCKINTKIWEGYMIAFCDGPEAEVPKIQRKAHPQKRF